MTRSGYSQLAGAAVLAVATMVVARAAPRARSWTGDEGKDWNTAANWNPSGAPATGDTLTFASGGKNANTNANIAPSLGGVTVTKAGYRISGLGLTLATNSLSSIEKDFDVDSLSGGGTIQIVNNTTLKIGHNSSDAPSTFGGTIAGSSATLTKDGPSRFTFSGDASGVLKTNVKEGALVLAGGILGETVVSGKSTLVMIDGRTARLTVRNNTTFGDDTARIGRTGDLELEGADYIQPIAGPDSFHRIFVTGAVRVSRNGKTSLSVRLVGGYRPAAGTTFIMVDNDGHDPVDGVFRDLPEGSTIEVDGVTFRLSYTAGNGNDIGLTTAGGGPVLQGDLAVSQATSGSFSPGGTGTVTITVRNAGAGDVTGTVTVSDTLPAGFSPTSASGQGWSCAINGQAVSCARATPLAASASYPAITIAVHVAATAQTATNTATVSWAGDPNPANNQAQAALTTVATRPNLTLTVTHAGEFRQGGTGSFQIVARNVGTAASSGTVTVEDEVPADLTPTSATGPGWSCAIAEHAVTCSRTDALAAGASAGPITIAVAVSATASSQVENTATIAGGGDATPGNNYATDVVAIAPPPTPDPTADLAIAKRHPGAYTPGQTDATFSIDVSNVGPAPTTGTVSVVDVLPNGFTPTSARGTDWACQVAGMRVTCTRGDALAPGASYPDVTIVMTVAAAAQTTANAAAVSGGGDTNTTNNTASEPFVVGAAAGAPNLTIAKSHTGDFAAGQQGATYQILVGNIGSSPTTGEVLVEDPLPPGLTPVSASGDGWTCSLEGVDVLCSRTDSLGANGAWPAITIVVNVGQTAGTVTNIATVEGGGDLSPDDNVAADATTVVGSAQLTVAQTHSAPVIQGDEDEPFTIVVSNNGLGATTGTVTVTSTMPAGLTPTEASGHGWGCAIAGATTTCTRGDALPQGRAFPAVQIRASVAADAVSVFTTVTVAGGGDATPADNTYRDHVFITPQASQPNLVLEKRHDGDFRQGQTNAEYKLLVMNQGSIPSAGEVVLTDDLPAGLTPVSAAGAGWTCTVSAPRVECRRSDALQPLNEFGEITIVVLVSSSATDVVNIAHITGGGDQTPADNTADDPTRITTVAIAPDLTVNKEHTGPFMTGQTDATYRITVQNVGAAATTGEVVVVDQVPAGLQPASAGGAGWACGVNRHTVTCRRSDPLAPGASYPVISLVVTVLATASNADNVVEVSGGGDANPGNNRDIDPTSINASPDPALTLTRVTPLGIGTTAEYDVTIRNVGSGWQGGETSVVTTFSVELQPVSALGAGWQCTRSGQQMRCVRTGALGPDAAFPTIEFRVFVRDGPAPTAVSSRVSNKADANAGNNLAELHEVTSVPMPELTVEHTTSTPRVDIGGVAGFSVTVSNTGHVRVNHVVVHDVLPRGFKVVDSTREETSSERTPTVQTTSTENAELIWPILTLGPDEVVTLTFQALVGAEARTGPQNATVTVTGDAVSTQDVSAGPAVATVDVVNETFSMRQMLVGRVFEDVNGDGLFGANDRPIPDARVVTSTGQAAITDAAGLYNIPSLGAGSAAISLDPLTLPAGSTLDDGTPGGRSWTRLLRTPIGGGTLLTQNFAVTRAAAPAAVPAAAPASSLLVALGEMSFGRAAQEFELFEQDRDAWGYGSLFYRGTVGSAANRLTLSFDTHRRLNHTTDHERMFELDPGDRVYPVFGDSSVREELAMANSKFYARFERGSSYAMFGDVAGDLPSSRTTGGRLSSYQRHLTGAEVKLADAHDNYVMVRAAQPSMAYARDVSAVRALGLIQLSHTGVLAGTEVVAVEVRDRRMPDRVRSRDVLTRFVDYQIEPATGTIFLTRHVGALDQSLDLVQVVVTYEYQSQGVEHLVFSGRAQGSRKGTQVGAGFFTEEGLDDRFTVIGLDAEHPLPKGGRVRVDLPYSTGTPNVTAAVDHHQVDPGRDTGGFALQADLEQPFALWQGVARASVLHADPDFRNPFAATITPGATYAGGSAELKPRPPSRVRFGGTYEHHDKLLGAGEASRVTFSSEWAETIREQLTLSAGYDARSLDRSGATFNSGLFTGRAAYKRGRLEARVGFEQNVREGTDPTYPDQTTLGARFRINNETALFYSQRISDSPIVPVGDFTGTGLFELSTTNDLSVGVESSVTDTTQLTSQYRIEQGINGPDAFAVIGAITHFKIGGGFGLSFGGEHGQVVSGLGDSFTNGSVAIDWTQSNRFKAAVRWDVHDREGLANLLTGGAAARLAAGVTALGRVRWTTSDHLASGDALSGMAALAIRPVSHDRLGALFSYRYLNHDNFTTAVGPGLSIITWRHLLSTDGYAQPVRWLEFHGKVTWQQMAGPHELATDTYLGQGRVQVALSRWVDAAFEERYLRETLSDSHRTGSAIEAGFWPLADFRLAVGYHFQDTRDPYGRDLQGRAKGPYFTMSTKLSRLFDLLGTPVATPGK